MEIIKMKSILGSLVLLVTLVMFSGIGAASDSFTIDPMYLGVGARSLGMGRTFASMSDDLESVYINPAGLSSASSIKASSMFSQLFEDVDYKMLSVVSPISKDLVVGLGYMGIATANIDLYDEFGGSTGSTSYSNSLAYVSLGYKIDKNISFGANLKYFSQGYDESQGTGYGADIGIIYDDPTFWSVGAVYQNAVSSGLKMSSGAEEGIPSVLVLGLKADIAGRETSLLPKQKYDLILTADYSLNGREIPNTVSAGVEYRPLENIAIRGGVCQNINDEETIVFNPTAGVGLLFDGYSFDYAYMSDSLAENSKHFFSFSWDLGYKDKIEAKNETEKKVEIAEEKKNEEKLAAKSEAGLASPAMLAQLERSRGVVTRKVTRETKKIVKLVEFPDVTILCPAKKDLEYAATAKLIGGYPDGTFKPYKSLTRAELVAMLMKAKGLTNADFTGLPLTSFKDVKGNHWAKNYIKAAVAMDLVQGYPGNLFRPNKIVSRAEAAAIFARFEGLKIRSAETSAYLDISKKHWASRYIITAEKAGLLERFSSATFSPNKSLERSEAVEMLVRTSLGKEKIKAAGLEAGKENTLSDLK